MFLKKDEEGSTQRGKMTAKELSKYFSQKKSPEELQSIIASSKRSNLKSQGNVKRVKHIRKIVDCGNRRYAASQASTFMGGLLMGTHQSKFMPVVEPIDTTKIMLAE